MLKSYISESSKEVASVGAERFSKTMSLSASISSVEKNLDSIESPLHRADVVFVTLDLDGVVFDRYDDRGRPINEKNQWTDLRTSKELKALGQSFLFLKRACENQGKKFILGLNTNREKEQAMSVFAQFPEEIIGFCLASLEAGHVLMHTDSPSFTDETKFSTTSLPDNDPKIVTLKQSIAADLQEAFDNQYFGSQAYKPERDGMITFRGVSSDFVGWDDDAKTVSGPLLSILEKHGYPQNQNFKVAYYPFDGGLDIQFSKYNKKGGETDLIDMAAEVGLIQKGQEVIQIHLGDTWSDAIEGSGMTRGKIWYHTFTIAVANSQQRFLDSAALSTHSNSRWGIFEAVRLLNTMLTVPKQEIKKRIDSSPSIVKLIQSYLGPEHPQATDFNLKEVINGIDVERLAELMHIIESVKRRNGRVFIIGNGGSYDNARLIGLLLRKQGVKADVPGSGQKYLEAGLADGHDFIFEKTLSEQELNSNDFLITISGSGNSPNILKAIEYAKTVNTQVFALGGRDGGKMAELTGNKNAFIARSNTMEIIEDVHAVLGYMIATSLGTSDESLTKKLETQRARSIKIIEQLLATENSHGLGKILQAVEKTLITRGRIVIIGDSLSANHIRADLARGATNQLPFSFKVVENVGSTNSMLATQNDDGADFTLVHALENIRPQIGDIVIVFNSPGRSQDYSLNLCYDLAQDNKAQVFLIGDNLPTERADVKFTGSQEDYELMSTILADLIGRTLHEDLVNTNEIEIKEFNPEILPEEPRKWLKTHLRSNRKLSQRETLKFENTLRHINISTDPQKFVPLLPDGKIITFCYGKIFIVDTPEKLGLDRSFY